MAVEEIWSGIICLVYTNKIKAKTPHLDHCLKRYVINLVLKMGKVSRFPIYSCSSSHSFGAAYENDRSPYFTSLTECMVRNPLDEDRKFTDGVKGFSMLLM